MTQKMLEQQFPERTTKNFNKKTQKNLTCFFNLIGVGHFIFDLRSLKK